MGFPLVLAAATTVAGSSGVPLSCAALFIGTAVLLYAAVRTSGGSRLHALVTVTLFGLLPSGVFAPMLLSEGTLMLGISASIYGVVLLLRQEEGRSRAIPGVEIGRAHV